MDEGQRPGRTERAGVNTGVRKWSSGNKPQSGAGSRQKGIGNTNAAAAYMQYYQAQAERERELGALRQALAKNAYEQNMTALNSAYDRRAGLLGENLQGTMEELRRGYEYALGKVNGNTDRALQEAYVNMMMERRDLPQLLAAQGITGGMSEGTLAGIRGSYSGERGRLETSRADTLGNLLNTLMNGQNEARQSYNSRMSEDNLRKTDAMMRLQQALADGIKESMINQYKSLSNLDGAYLQQMLKLGQTAKLDFGAQAGESSLMRALNAPMKTDVEAAGGVLKSGTGTARQLKALPGREEVSGGSAIVTLMNAGWSEAAARALLAKNRHAKKQGRGDRP